MTHPEEVTRLAALPDADLATAMLARLDGNKRERHHHETTGGGWRSWRCVPVVDAVQAAHDAAHPDLAHKVRDAIPAEPPTCGEPVALFGVPYGEQYEPCGKPKGHDGYHVPEGGMPAASPAPREAALREALEAAEAELGSARRLAADDSRGPDEALRWKHYAEGMEEALRIVRLAATGDASPGPVLDAELRDAAVEWWTRHRPVDWDEATHREYPTINVSSEYHRLARAAARLSDTQPEPKP